MWPYARAARMGDLRNPKGRISVSLKMDKLMINNQTFTKEYIDNVPEYVKSRAANPPSTITMNNVTIFVTKNRPFSTFYRCEFEINNVKCSSSEQYLYHKEALMLYSALAAQEELETDDSKSKKDNQQLANFYEARCLSKRLVSLNQCLWPSYLKITSSGPNCLTMTKLSWEKPHQATYYLVSVSHRKT